MPTLAAAAPTVNPTPAELRTADRLAWQADGGDLDAYRPGWHEPAPSAEDEAHELGYSIGREGDNPELLTVYGLERAATLTTAVRHAFHRGVLAGRGRHAFAAGHALGLAGQFCERPGSIHRRFNRDFEAGWQVGADLWADRQEIQREWAADVEADAQERDLVEHNREAGGWLTTGHMA